MTKKANCLAFGSTRPTEELLPKPLRVVTFTAGEGATTGEKKKKTCARKLSSSATPHQSSRFKKEKKKLCITLKSKGDCDWR